MGTVVSVDVRDPGVEPAALDALFAHLHDIDARFSPYRPDSEIARLGTGALDVSDASADVRAILGWCDELARETGGAFDARRHRTDNRLDPSGLVKGWAVEGAAGILDAAGARNYAINAGGDVIARGKPEPGRRWRVGIRHPEREDAIAAVLEVSSLAVATSGDYERGAHIRDPRTGRTPAGLRSVTVVGPSLALADVYATTAFVMGAAGPAWVAGRHGYGALAITTDGRIRWTEEIDPLLVS
jgi:thiamine biosynthesis lipoprotein